MSQLTPVPAAERTRRTVPLALLAMVVAAFAGYTVGGGRDSEVVTEGVECLSVPSVIGCTLGDGVDVAVPLDVAWTDAAGSLHDSGRPECLPPDSVEETVRVSWTEVEVDRRSWRQVVHVGCPR